MRIAAALDDVVVKKRFKRIGVAVVNGLEHGPKSEGLDVLIEEMNVAEIDNELLCGSLAN